MTKHIRAALIAAASFVALGATAAQASTVTVTTLNGSQGWTSPAGENTGGGSASITATPIDGAGSLAVTGDRSRVVYGSLYNNPGATGLGAVSQFTDLSFKYEIDPASVSNYDPKYSPALRLVFWDANGQKQELVYEAAYQNGSYGAQGAIGSVNTTSASSLFYLLGENDPNHALTISQWLTLDPSFTSDQVGGFYIGVGSGVGAQYLAHVDDVVANGTTYNFELPAVPEPASWALMIAGMAGMGAMLRRRKIATA